MRRATPLRFVWLRLLPGWIRSFHSRPSIPSQLLLEHLDTVYCVFCALHAPASLPVALGLVSGFNTAGPAAHPQGLGLEAQAVLTSFQRALPAHCREGGWPFLSI